MESRPLREVVSWNTRSNLRQHNQQCRPLREVVSWNSFSSLCASWYTVDLFVRSWVETFKAPCFPRILLSSTSSWGRELKQFSQISFQFRPKSTSSWGRELKHAISKPLDGIVKVDLFVRSWVETQMFHLAQFLKLSTSSWGRELKLKDEQQDYENAAVDLFVRSWVETYKDARVDQNVLVDLFVRSWVETCPLWNWCMWNHSRPLREVVSWNTRIFRQRQKLWKVDLFVRSWVETDEIRRKHWKVSASTSSWGRELKHLHIRDHIFQQQSTSSWGRELKLFCHWQGVKAGPVDLFVRSWVETCCRRKERTPWRMSTSSWGRELKHLQIWFDAL